MAARNAFIIDVVRLLGSLPPAETMCVLAAFADPHVAKLARGALTDGGVSPDADLTTDALAVLIKAVSGDDASA